MPCAAAFSCSFVAMLISVSSRVLHVIALVGLAVRTPNVLHVTQIRTPQLIFSSLISEKSCRIRPRTIRSDRAGIYSLIFRDAFL